MNIKNVIYGLAITGALAVNIWQRPPTWVYVAHDPITVEAEIDGARRTLEARLVWRQNGFAMWGVFHFFPTDRDLVFRNAEHGVTWDVNPDFEESLREEYRSAFRVPTWKYFLATLTLLALGALHGLRMLWEAIVADRRAWRNAVSEDTFASHNRYLLRAGWPKLYTQRARSAMTQRAREYRSFYAALASYRDGKGRDALLEILDSIGESGVVSVGVSFSFDNKIKEIRELDEERVAAMERTLRSLPEGQPETAGVRAALIQQRDALRARRDWKVAKVGPQFTSKQNKGREALVTKLIDRVFANVFPERIIAFEYGGKDHPVQLRISYTVTTTGALYSSTREDKVPDSEKQHFTGIAFAWDFRFSRNGREILRASFESRPASSFTAGGSSTEAVYKTMAMSAFVNFGRELLEYFGIGVVDSDASLGALRSKDAATQGFRGLFGEFRREFAKELAEDGVMQMSEELARFFHSRSDELGETMKAALHEVESVLGMYVRGLSAGVDLGDLGAEALAGLFDG